jgi:hypothetical protein
VIPDESYRRPGPGALRPDQGQVYSRVGVRLISQTIEAPFIVVTPTCDFHQKKVKEAVVLPILPLSLFVMIVNEELGFVWDPTLGVLRLDGGKDKRDKLRGKLHSLVKGNLPSVHYLPPSEHFSDSFVSFTMPTSVRLSEFDDKELLTALVPPYREHIATRFSSYYLRVGTPDFPEHATELYNKFTVEAAQVQPAV